MGSKYTGVTGQLLYKKETDWGSVVTPDSYFGRASKFSFEERNGLIRDLDMGSRDTQNLILGNYKVTGVVGFDVINFAIFEIILGSVSGAGTAASPFIYTRHATDIPGCTIEAGNTGDVNEALTVIGCKCSTAAIDFAQGAVIRAVTNWTALKATRGTTLQAYTAPTNAPFTFMQGTLERTNSNIGIVQSGSLKLNNNLIETFGIGSRFLQALNAGQLFIDFDFVVVLDSDMHTTLYQDFYGQAVASGPIDAGAATLSGFTLDLELTDGTNRVATIALSTATMEGLSRGCDMGNNKVMATFSGYAKVMQITSQVSA